MDNFYVKKFKMWGVEWETCFECNRPLHPEDPRYFINKDNVIVNQKNKSVTLTICHRPTTIEWYNIDWTLPKINYKPEYSCGLIKSIETVNVDSIIEVDLKFPKGANLWPSFLLLSDEIYPSEIDICEGYSDKNKSYLNESKLHRKWPFIYNEYRIESNIKYKDKDKNNNIIIGAQGIPEKFLNKPIEENWNKFRCVWTKSSIVIYVNDNIIRKITNKSILDKINDKKMKVVFYLIPNKQYIGKPVLISHKFEIKNFSITHI